MADEIGKLIITVAADVKDLKKGLLESKKGLINLAKTVRRVFLVSPVWLRVL